MKWELGTAPIVRLEVEGMKHSILSILDDRNEDLKNVITVGIDRAMKQLPDRLAQEVEEMSLAAMRDAMKSALEEYWSTGLGRKALDQMLAEKLK